MLSVAEALERILAPLSPLETEDTELDQALGRVLAEDANANLTQPPNDVSAMDGYAVRYQDIKDLPTILSQIGEVAAGGSYDQGIQSGETARIFTGGTVPHGADTVVMQENTEVIDDGRIQINDGATLGRHIRKAGTDFKQDDMGLPARHRIKARDLGFLAAMNVTKLKVTKRPKVAILATGDELVHAGETPGPNQIISSTPHALAAYIRHWGGEPIILGIARDNEASLREMAKGAEGADVMLTIGGASVGDHDLVQKVLGEQGLEVDFWKIAMKPGKPLIYGRINDIPLIGLPGNPVSSIVCSILYLKPAIAKLLGAEDTETQHTYDLAEVTKDLSENAGRQDYIRSNFFTQDGKQFVEPFGLQDSSVMSVLSKSNGLIVRPPRAEALKAGSQVPVLRFIQDV